MRERNRVVEDSSDGEGNNEGRGRCRKCGRKLTSARCACGEYCDRVKPMLTAKTIAELDAMQIVKELVAVRCFRRSCPTCGHPSPKLRDVHRRAVELVARMKATSSTGK